MSREGRRLGILIAPCLAFVLAAIGGAGVAGAATIRVDTTADQFNAGGKCSLREAISNANQDVAGHGCRRGKGADLILVPAGKHRLTRVGAPSEGNLAGDLNLTDAATVRHHGTIPAIVDGNDIDRVFDIAPDVAVTLSGLVIQNGRGLESGGGISNSGDLVIRGTTIRGNETPFAGGGVNTGTGSVTIVNTTISGNRADASGGGIFVNGGTVSVVSSTITGNRAEDDGDGTLGGGGIMAGLGSTTLRATILAGNIDGDPSPVDAPDCRAGAGASLSSINTMVGDPSGCTIDSPVEIPIGDPGLLGLAFNGGPTPTHALLPGSFPIGHGGAGCPPSDQRGAPRKKCDIGAYERVLLAGVLVNRVGTGQRNTLRGSAGRDGFLGLGGRDVLLGRKGRDVLSGGKGPDLLRGGPGRDLLLGGKGIDRCLGGPGKDVLKGCELGG